ncbi:MAG: hypothetical protein K2X08_00830, partial [Chlamydiales bacterium]|nr:hypothetical protein [Chlamydiales bacterium]
IIFACKDQAYSCGGNVILRLAGKKGCLTLFKIIGTEILKEKEHGQIDKEFKAHFSCHFLEAAINNNDLDLFESLCNHPEIQTALSANQVRMPVMPGYYSPTPLEYLKQKISEVTLPNRTKFTFMLKGKNRDSDQCSIRLIENYLAENQQEEAVGLLKMLVSTRPNIPLSDSPIITNLYIQMMDKGPIDASLFPQGEEFSFEQKLNYLFTLGPRAIKATIDELARDVQKCEELCSRKIDISHLYMALHFDNLGVHIDPLPITKALKEFHTQIDPPLSQYAQKEIRKWLTKIPLKTLALITRCPESEQLILPYLPYMNNAQLAVTVPQLSKEALFQYITRCESSLFIGEEQLNHVVDHILTIFDDSASVAKNNQDAIDQYRKKLESLQSRSDKTEIEAKQIYWDLDQELSDRLRPMLVQMLSLQNHLKQYTEDLHKTLRSRCSPSKWPALDQLTKHAGDFYQSVEEFQEAIHSLGISLGELTKSCGLEIPEEYCCPISCDLMRNPVIDQYGDSYEAEAIKIWINKNPQSPFRKGPLQINLLKENIKLKEEIETWKRKNGALPSLKE